MIPATYYKEPVSNGAPDAYYEVSVYHYPADYQFTGNYLNGALQVFYKVVSMAFPGSNLVGSQPTQFLGGSAISASISVPAGTSPSNDYLLITTNSHNTYIISTYGLAQSDYNAFINSFKFTP